MIRGGASKASATLLDLPRSILLVDAIASYPIVCAILMSASLDLSTSTPKIIKPIPPLGTFVERSRTRLDNCITAAFAFASSLSIVLGAYATIVFTLVAIYGRTALGRGLDAGFLKFTDAAAVYRVFAFRAFLGEVISYMVAVMLSRYLDNEGVLRWIETLPAVIVTALGLWHYRLIVDLANTLIFS